MKKLLFLAGTIASLANVNAQTCAAARAGGVSTNPVSVRAVCINGPELGNIRYLQDVTGGIAAYGNNLSTLGRGDSVIINGPVTEYKNLYEITPATFVYVAAGHLPDPAVITPAQFNESYESHLIKFINCTFQTTGTFGANVNYTVTSGSQTLAVRSNTASPMVGQPIPTGAVNIVGVGSQFCSSPTSGCTDGYQLLMRDMNDITAYVPTGPTGIEEVVENTTIAVFPNPASSTVNFTVKNNEKVQLIQVTDLTGRLVLSVKENVSSVDVSGLSKGLYNMSVSTDKRSYKAKVVVE